VRAAQDALRRFFGSGGFSSGGLGNCCSLGRGRQSGGFAFALHVYITIAVAIVVAAPPPAMSAVLCVTVANRKPAVFAERAIRARARVAERRVAKVTVAIFARVFVLTASRAEKINSSQESWLRKNP
jgi:hypothetical protein